MGAGDKMANKTLYELLGVSKEQTDEIAKKVGHCSPILRSRTSGFFGWLKSIISIRRTREIFACGWFAGKYAAGVSEVFNVVQREMDERVQDDAKKKRAGKPASSPRTDMLDD